MMTFMNLRSTIMSNSLDFSSSQMWKLHGIREVQPESQQILNDDIMSHISSFLPNHTLPEDVSHKLITEELKYLNDSRAFKPYNYDKHVNGAEYVQLLHQKFPLKRSELESEWEQIADTTTDTESDPEDGGYHLPEDAGEAVNFVFDGETYRIYENNNTVYQVIDTNFPLAIDGLAWGPVGKWCSYHEKVILYPLTRTVMRDISFIRKIWLIKTEFICLIITGLLMIEVMEQMGIY